MRFKKVIVPGAGFILLALGAIGVVIPLWPTTPFVLASVACFSSSPRIKSRIMKIDFINAHYQNYNKKIGLSTKTVLISLFWLWSTLLLSMATIRTIWIVILLLFIGLAVTAHILFVARPRNNKAASENKQI